MKTPQAAIDRLLEKDPQLRLLQRVLLEQQETLKRAVDPVVFALYLDIEATSNRLLDAVSQKAWAAGRSAK